MGLTSAGQIARVVDTVLVVVLRMAMVMLLALAAVVVGLLAMDIQGKVLEGRHAARSGRRRALARVAAARRGSDMGEAVLGQGVDRDMAVGPGLWTAGRG